MTTLGSRMRGGGGPAKELTVTVGGDIVGVAAEGGNAIRLLSWEDGETQYHVELAEETKQRTVEA